MTPAPKDITFTRGDTYSLFGRVRDRVWNPATEAYEPGSYKDLTGWTGRADVRKTKSAGSVLFSFTVTLGNQSTTPGSFFLTALPADTESIANTDLSGYYDLQWVTAAGEKYTYMEGTVTLREDVTRG